MIRKKAQNSPRVTPISSILLKIKRKELIIKPSYQREYVWNRRSEKDELMRSIFLNYPIGVITINSHNDEKPDEIIDGLQRIRTIESFCGGEDIYSKINRNVSNNIINEYINDITNDYVYRKDKNAKRILDNLKRDKTTLLTYANLPECLRDLFDRYQLSINAISKTDKENVRNFFRVLQIQERLKAGEIINSLLSNDVLNILTNYKNIDQNLKDIKFKNIRQDFQKYLILFHGIVSNKIKFGVSDKIIIKYAEKMTPNASFNYKLKLFFEKLNNFNIKSTPLYSDRSFNKLSMKLLIGIYILKSEYIESKEIHEIIQKLYYFSELNSMQGSINNRYKQIPPRHKENIKQIWKISKTTHSNKVLLSKLDNLIDFLENTNVNYVRRKYKKNKIKNEKTTP